mgnify:FL=1
MLIHTYEPSPVLRPVVKHFWELKTEGCCGIHTRQMIIPEGLAELVFYLENVPVYRGSFGCMSSPVVFSGQHNQPYYIESNGPLHLFAVVFQPAFSSGFFDHPANLFQNQVIDAQLLGINGYLTELYGKLKDQETAAAKIIAIEGGLKKWYGQKDLVKFSRIAESMKYLIRNCGNIKVPELASRACLGRKQFERLFLQVTGLSPAAFSRIVRFQYALHLHNQHRNYTLTAIGHSAGYFDQSHMIREFKQLSGMSPRAFFAGGPSISDFYLSV